MNKPVEKLDVPITAAEDIPADLTGIVEKIEEIRAQEKRLPAERKLSELIGVKRHQIRRALAAMRDNGDLPQPKRRARRSGASDNVSDLVHNTNPVEVVELRLMIEPTLARLAALRATPAKIEDMRQAVRDIASGRSSVDLHRMIADASGNALASELYALLRRIDADAKLNMPREQAEPLDIDKDTSEHGAIVEAIASRAPDLAEEAMRKHLMAIHRIVLMGPH
ncbi:FadR/GntR family transcriptional regulator [Pseudooceanicola nanhaiensis]|uniref:FadR/GntR family transcriptional regulator n=1 Tax=Pseudooceanicola nanhaiensis TaxID=375761 RepID=UPI001CD3E607|nr:FCD domain-containing protein [Pseudooceanicola nanhaiensis]MCA0921277.1 FCD domain-containing protein [Pseudooceanicola nanhaiensis]